MTGQSRRTYQPPPSAFPSTQPLDHVPVHAPRDHGLAVLGTALLCVCAFLLGFVIRGLL